jgi:hypothetical protein
MLLWIHLEYYATLHIRIRILSVFTFGVRNFLLSHFYNVIIIWMLISTQVRIN